MCRLKAEVHFNPWSICDRFLDAQSTVTPATVQMPNSGRDAAGENDILAGATNLAKITHALEKEMEAGGGEEETRRVLRRFSRMYMTTLAMEIDRIESELRHAFPEFK